jgi:hypothetical protein
LTDVLVVGNSKSADIALLGKVDQVWSILFLTCDDALAQLPFSKKSSKDDQYCSSLLVDFTDSTPITSSKSDNPPIPPSPILWILTNEGTLAPFRLVNSQSTTMFRLMKPLKNEIDLEKLEKAKADLESKGQEEKKLAKSPEPPKPEPVPPTLPITIPISRKPDQPIIPQQISVNVEYFERKEYSGYENNLSELFCKLHSSVKADLQSNLSKLNQVERLIDTIRNELSGLNITERDNQMALLTDQIQKLVELKGQCNSLFISLSTPNGSKRDSHIDTKFNDLNDLCSDAQTYLNLKPNSELVASFYSSAIKQRSENLSRAILETCTTNVKQPFIPKINPLWKNRQVFLRELQPRASMILSSSASSLSEIFNSADDLSAKSVLVEMDFSTNTPTPPLSLKEPMKQIPIKVSEQKINETILAKLNGGKKENGESINILPTAIEKPKELKSPVEFEFKPAFEEQKIEISKPKPLQNNNLPLFSSPLSVGEFPKPPFQQPVAPPKPPIAEIAGAKKESEEKQDNFSFGQLKLSTSPPIVVEPAEPEKKSFTLFSPPSLEKSKKDEHSAVSKEPVKPISFIQSSSSPFAPKAPFNISDSCVFGTQASISQPPTPKEAPIFPSQTSANTFSLPQSNFSNQGPTSNFISNNTPFASFTPPAPPSSSPTFGASTAFGSASSFGSQVPVAAPSFGTNVQGVFGQQRQSNISFASFSTTPNTAGENTTEKKELPKSFTQFRG